MHPGNESPKEIFEDLYQRYYRAVVAYFFRLGFSRDEARDLAQDAFLRVYQGMASYRRESKWLFLMTIANRVALNKIRSSKAQKNLAPLVPLDSLSEAPAGDPTREAELIEREERERRVRRLTQAIAELPPKIRMCVELRLGSLSYREIQKILGITLDTVKTRLNDARNLLRTKLREEPGDFDRLHGCPDV